MRSSVIRFPLTFQETIFILTLSVSTNLRRYNFICRATQSLLTSGVALVTDEEEEEDECVEEAGEAGLSSG